MRQVQRLFGELQAREVGRRAETVCDDVADEGCTACPGVSFKQNLRRKQAESENTVKDTKLAKRYNHKLPTKNITRPGEGKRTHQPRKRPMYSFSHYMTNLHGRGLQSKKC